MLKAQHRVFQENDEETLRERLETYELQSDTQEKALTLHKLGVIYQSIDILPMRKRRGFPPSQVGVTVSLEVPSTIPSVFGLIPPPQS